jgi:alpha-beta hydrolase superfamily lysophospholipase
MMIRFLQRRWTLLAGFFFVSLAIGVVASLIAGSLLCAPSNCPVPAPADLAVEPVSFSSESGATIHGWLVASMMNRGVVILQHSVRANRLEMVGRARFLSQAGYAVLLYDFQAHGESIGKKITFGFLESRDAQAAVAFVKQRFPGKPVGVIGVSLGAAAAALAQPPLDAQALVLEMMYPTIVDATKDRIEIRFGPLGRCLSPLLTSQLKLRIGCNLDDLRPVIRVAQITAPKLFLAGTMDRDTKFSEAKKIFEQAADPKTFAPFEGAQHQDLNRFAPEQYQKLILKFLEEHLQ